LTLDVATDDDDDDDDDDDYQVSGRQQITSGT